MSRSESPHPTDRPIRSRIRAAAALAVLTCAASAHAGGFMIPIPDRGALPLVVQTNPDHPLLRAEQLQRGQRRAIERQIKALRRKHFGRMRDLDVRQAGIERLAEYDDPIGFEPMIEVLENEQPDVQAGLVRHFQNLGDRSGDAALAFMALRHKQEPTRDMALNALTDRMYAEDDQLTDAARALIEADLRSNYHARAGRAAQVAQHLRLYEMIPIMIVAQVAQQRRGQQGDLAYIAIATQTSFVADLTPVVSENAVGFDPEIGVISEGVVLRVQDLVVQVYRHDVHNALVDLTSEDWGESTMGFGFDIRAWRNWYEAEYRPYREQVYEEERLERETRAAEQRDALEADEQAGD
jgi:hypothetical protein